MAEARMKRWLGNVGTFVWGRVRALRPRASVAVLAGGLAVLACALPGVPAHTPTPAAMGTGISASAPTPTGMGTGISASAPTAAPTGSSGAGDVRFVPGSSQKVCQLVGETDRQRNTPTLNQTETRWGLIGNDLGYSFEHDGKLFFVFGDSQPTRAFNGQANGPNSPNRNPDDNDALAFTTDTALNPCPRLTFIHYPNGAFKNPLVLNAQGQPAITLRTDEIPLAGFSEAGRMFVVFATDNPVYPPGPTQGHLGAATRSVVGVSDDDGNTFHALYDFSKGPDARFINLAIAPASDGYVYFWGTQGGDHYRKSAPYLARKPAGGLANAGGREYLRGLDAAGAPSFSPNEADAAPLFHDQTLNAAGQTQTADCLGELSASWNAFLSRWLLLYNCADSAPGHPRGIYLRAAPQPWGPWSDPQTIFDPARDNGFCQFIHRAVSAAQPQCDNLAGPSQLAESGGDYGPYVLGRYTTGDAAQGATTIYYTLSTWIPYTEVIMQTSLRRAS